MLQIRQDPHWWRKYFRYFRANPDSRGFILFVLRINTQKQFLCSIFMHACALLAGILWPVLGIQTSWSSAQPEKTQILESAFNFVLHKNSRHLRAVSHQIPCLDFTYLHSPFVHSSPFLYLVVCLLCNHDRLLSKTAIISTCITLPDVSLFHKSVTVRYYTGI